MSFETKLFHKLFYKEVGTDHLGNKYYESKCHKTNGKNRRSVWYNGTPEPSRVPPMWHSWLHYTTDEIPASNVSYTWQIDHVPNLTGTDYAYRPNGHIYNGGKRDKATGDYEAWNPNEVK
ncbi:MAG: NADH:ubiquinone oxidoreductase subunit NDUFA12 [Alphaproteobacteria bacterium]|mgnify:CR=1 FL=1|nr:NADH:ubiquinone oxidoreductase subunit NDUFA12 [Alphaproteobacteria bacterium]